jgi:hypothetical protein
MHRYIHVTVQMMENIKAAMVFLRDNAKRPMTPEQEQGLIKAKQVVTRIHLRQFKIVPLRKKKYNKNEKRPPKRIRKPKAPDPGDT